MVRSVYLTFRWLLQFVQQSYRNIALAQETGADIHPLASFADRRCVTVGKGTVIARHACLLAWKSGRIRIGERSQVNIGSILRADDGVIQIGDDCSLQYGSVIYGAGGVTIGDGVRISAGVHILAVNHRFDDVSRPIYQQGTCSRGIHIESDVWIGAAAILLDGTTIGRGSVIGAGAVVTGPVPPYSVLVGNPGRVVRNRMEGGEDAAATAP